MGLIFAIALKGAVYCGVGLALFCGGYIALRWLYGKLIAWVVNTFL